MRHIELLAPARNLECGIEAIRHGADAVYIGAERFGARAAAGNSVDDIRQLVDYAHIFGVRIYVTVNTLLHDDELTVVDNLIDQLADAGVDALIVQDPRLMELSRGRISLHASTQMDNRTHEQVQRLWDEGYEQAVLARELSLDEIRSIHEHVPQMPLEVFIHGALCVCYSGRCFASEHLFNRSANRGECAQVCRLAFDLIDGEGRVLQRGKHLLSLRDMNRSSDLEALLDAGASSLKIEGRLKDVGYVKNITAYYRQQLDAIFRRRPNDYARSSAGKTVVQFTPNPQKSFNRGFTNYFLHGRTNDLASIDTPKSIGEPVGTVKEIRGNLLTVAGTKRFENGDGLCFFDSSRRLHGFRVNSVDSYGRLTIARQQDISSLLQQGTKLYRNQDQAFDRILSRPSADRRLAVKWLLEDIDSDGFRLTLTDELGRTVSKSFSYPHQIARTPQREAIGRQLSRLGDTPYEVADIEIRVQQEWFIPASVLGEWRRTICDKMRHSQSSPITPHSSFVTHHLSLPTSPSGGLKGAFPLMTCRYCLRYQLGCCHRHQNYEGEIHEPWRLRMSDGQMLTLRFDCRNCQMEVLNA